MLQRLPQVLVKPEEGMSRTLGIIGAGILLVGLFVPLSRSFAADTATVIDFPALTYFAFIRNGDWNAIVFLLFAVGSACLRDCEQAAI